MKIALVVSAVIVMWSTTAFAQQPAVYPLRSQPAATQGVDSAYCYWQAKRQTGVNMTRLSQRPSRIRPIQSAPDTGRGASAPPLPAAHGVPEGAAKTPKAPAMASDAGGASAGTGAPPRGARANAASASEGAAQAASSASGVPGAAAASASASASANLPPLPPPQPPMTTYWQAYGDCMQSRGYGVR